ncbi:MAG: hypothetical protein AMXMBFR13_18150 [Phycisphaerae bacterium]
MNVAPHFNGVGSPVHPAAAPAPTGPNAGRQYPDRFVNSPTVRFKWQGRQTLARAMNEEPSRGPIKDRWADERRHLSPHTHAAWNREVFESH